MSSAPVLFLVFNRPRQTALTFEAIRKLKPADLFIAADGARDNKPSESEKCDQVRQICSNIDWPCNVRKLYREKNLGCEIAVGEAITWFFNHVEQGVILEDDCLPSQSFFEFCNELLERFKNTSEVGAITGNNFQWGKRTGASSYYFSKYMHVWGWATWRRAWQVYDYEMSVSKRSDKDVITRFGTVQGEKEFWTREFQSLRKKEMNTWDIRWLRSLWKEGMLVVTPEINLVKNIGCGEDATHTQGNARVPDSHEIAFPLLHPQNIVQSVEADHRVARTMFVPPIWRKVSERVQKWLRIRE